MLPYTLNSSYVNVFAKIKKSTTKRSAHEMNNPTFIPGIKADLFMLNRYEVICLHSLRQDPCYHFHYFMINMKQLANVAKHRLKRGEHLAWLRLNVE